MEHTITTCLSNLPSTDSHHQTFSHSIDVDGKESDALFQEPPNLSSEERFASIPKTTLPQAVSLGSLLDYQRTKDWLRDTIRYPESYTTKLTTRLLKNTAKRGLNDSQVPSINEIQLAQRVTGMSEHTTRSDSKFNGFLFRKAVGDLERIVNEALAITSEAINSSAPADTATGPDHQGSNGSNLEKRRQELMRLLQGLSSQSQPDFSGSDISELLEVNPKIIECDTPSDSDDDEENIPCWHHSLHMKSGNAMQKPSLQNHVRFKITDQIHQKDGNNDDGPNSVPDRPKRGPVAKHISSPFATPGVEESMFNFGTGDDQLPERDIAGREMRAEPGISLRKRSHVSLRGHRALNLARSRRRQPIARDWSTMRKRFVASVACISTALIGILTGIYAGLVPSIQYYIVDESHVTVLGNTGCFVAMALPTLLFWPLPLLHGRKPYILSSLVLAMPLLFPQALAVNSQRLTDTISWRSMLLAARALMGSCLGFASMNFHSILMDLFGASLMSVNPHQEIVDQYDARRHGGGMGAWLGMWTWCWIGSLAIGFLVGAAIIDNYHPAWGFYVSIILIAVVLFLNVLCPETRRSAYRRSVAEVRTGSDISRRIARGEIMMHRTKTGPKWWGEEVYHGIAMSLEMLRQPGFLIISLYSAWVYAQVVLLIVLLGSLASRYYSFRSTQVGLLVAAIALGALFAIPFQKANLFSRSRVAQLNTNKATLDKRVAWSSHMVRRTVFTILLPITGGCYAAVSSGPPLHISLPTLFATAFGFLSCLAISECNGFIMEAFDCSDLSPGMTGRQRGSTARHPKKTNYSSFPRVTAGFAVIHSFSFILAAGATALGGKVTRVLGQQVATGVVAAILLILTLMLLLVLVRFMKVQIIPRSKFEEIERLMEFRRRSTIRRASMPDNVDAILEEERAWRPMMIGNPIGKTRRMNILELGSMTRWQEIRKKNKLIDSGAHKHLNRTAWNQGLDALDDQMSDFKRDAQEFLHLGRKRKGKRRLRRSEEQSSNMDFSSYSMSDQGPSKSTRRPRLPRDESMNQIVDHLKDGQRRD